MPDAKNDMQPRAAGRMYIMLMGRTARPTDSELLAVEIIRRLIQELTDAEDALAAQQEKPL